MARPGGRGPLPQGSRAVHPVVWGERHTEQSVEDVLLANVRFIGRRTRPGVKTWQGGRGHVRNVTFSNLDVRAVGQPLVVDQFYCPASQHRGTCANETDAVAVSDVTVSGLTGWHTSASPRCSTARSQWRGVVAAGIVEGACPAARGTSSGA